MKKVLVALLLSTVLLLWSCSDNEPIGDLLTEKKVVELVKVYVKGSEFEKDIDLNSGKVWLDDEGHFVVSFLYTRAEYPESFPKEWRLRKHFQVDRKTREIKPREIG